MSACPPKPAADEPAFEPGCAADLQCASDRDCGVAAFCNRFNREDDTLDEVGCCFDFSNCATDEDCADNERCERLVCTLQTCINTLPLDDDELADPFRECPDGVCLYVDGEPGCTTAPPPPVSCVVVAPVPTVSERPVRIEARALDVRGAPAPYPPSATWTASSGGVDGDVFAAPCTGPDVCNVTLTATMGSVSCDGVVRVFPAAPPDATRVIVVDGAARALVVGGARIEGEVGGAWIVDASDADGAVVLPGLARIVNVMPADHEWHTLIEPPRDVIVVVERTRDAATVSGLKGDVDFTSVHTTGDIEVALVGFALPSLSGFELERVLGRSTTRLVDIQGITDPGGVPMRAPSSMVMDLGDNALFDEGWVAFGEGSSLWSIGGRVALAELGPIISLTDGFAIVHGLLQTQFLSRFDHAHHFALAELQPASAGDDVAFDEWAFREETTRPSVLLRAARSVLVDEQEAAADVLGVALARIPGAGFVPLGIASARADDGAESGAPPGQMYIDFATPHDGLEGSEVVVVALALDPASIVDSTSRVSVAAAFAPLGTSESITMPAFSAPLASSYDGAGVVSTNDPATGAYRVRFDGDGGRWTVWSPAPPAFALAELHAGDVDVTGRTAFARVEALSLTVSYAELVDAGGASMLDLDRVVASLSSEPCVAGGACNRE